MTVQTAPTVLESQIRLFAEQATACAGERLNASDRADLEAVIALGLTTFGQIRRAEERAGEAARFMPGGSDVTAARELAVLYRRWCAPSEAILSQVKLFRGDGQRIDRSDEFIQACRHARIPAYYTEQLVAALGLS